jgi:hypothetical protein
MRSVLFTTLAVLVAIFFVASPKPASATPAAAALNYSPATASEVVPVRRWYRRRYYRRPYYGRRYYRRPYYGRRYYRRPYYGRRYYYRRRRGVSVYIGI